jgi:hypothetical protein
MPTPKGRAWREALSGPPGPVNQSGGQCGRARASVVAAADERLAMPSEDWIQHSIVARVLYDWQTLIAGLLAVLAAWRTIRATTKSADREVAASQAQTAVAQKQIATTLRLDRQRVAREVYAFQATIWAAMEHVLLEASEAESIFPARRGFSKGAFPELRAACVRCGGLITRDLLELERDLDIFASQSQGEPGGLGELLRTRVHEQLGAIEFRATRLQREAVAAMERANAVIAEPEEPVSAPEPKRRSLLRYWFGWRAA